MRDSACLPPVNLNFKRTSKPSNFLQRFYTKQAQKVMVFLVAVACQCQKGVNEDPYTDLVSSSFTGTPGSFSKILSFFFLTTMWGLIFPFQLRKLLLHPVQRLSFFTRIWVLFCVTDTCICSIPHFQMKKNIFYKYSRRQVLKHQQNSRQDISVKVLSCIIFLWRRRPWLGKVHDGWHCALCSRVAVKMW